MISSPTAVVYNPGSDSFHAFDSWGPSSSGAKGEEDEPKMVRWLGKFNKCQFITSNQFCLPLTVQNGIKYDKVQRLWASPMSYHEMSRNVNGPTAVASLSHLLWWDTKTLVDLHRHDYLSANLDVEHISDTHRLSRKLTLKTLWYYDLGACKTENTYLIRLEVNKSHGMQEPHDVCSIFGS